MEPLTLLQETVQQNHSITAKDIGAHAGEDEFGFLAQRLDVLWSSGELGQCTVETLFL